jgi:hypothetical protein
MAGASSPGLAQFGRRLGEGGARSCGVALLRQATSLQQAQARKLQARQAAGSRMLLDEQMLRAPMQEAVAQQLPWHELRPAAERLRQRVVTQRPQRQVDHQPALAVDHLQSEHRAANDQQRVSNRRSVHRDSWPK